MKVGKFKISTIRCLRAVSQILFFIFLPGLYISTLSGIKGIYLSIYNHSFNFATFLPQITEVIAIIPITLFLGRFFCGWMCAFGALSDFIAVVSGKIFKRKFKINEKADRILKYTKYIWLCFLIIAVWSLGTKAFSSANPWDAFGMLLTLGKAPDFSYVVSNLAPALIILILIIFASFFVERFFCRYMCPLGAIFSIVSKPRITSIKKPKDKCGKCRVCTNSCPMGIPLYKKDSFKSGECIHCFECVTACPRKNCKLAVSDADIKPVIAGAVTVAAMTGIYYAGTFAATGLSMSKSAVETAVSAVSSGTTSQQTASSSAANNTTNTTESSSTTESSAAASSSTTTSAKYKDGTYEGSGTGFRGQTTTVSVTVKSGRISDISPVSTGDDGQFFDRAFPTVTQSIISSQSTEVDVVSGATFSSSGIMDAVANALSKAS